MDEVSDVTDLVSGQIEDVPRFGTDVDTSFLTGVGRVDERVVLLLDIDLACFRTSRWTRWTEFA